MGLKQKPGMTPYGQFNNWRCRIKIRLTVTTLAFVDEWVSDAASHRVFTSHKVAV